MNADRSSHGRPSAEQLLADYFRAKDGNRPHLLDRVFCPDARLEVRNATAAIEFPAATQGRDAIAEVLVRNFGRDNENVYSFYLSSPPAEAVERFRCDWLVGMTEKAGQSVKVGCGTYDWTLKYEPSPCATALVISIEVMQVLRPEEGRHVLAWLEGLAYPWCTAAAAARSAPAIAALRPVLDYLEGLGA